MAKGHKKLLVVSVLAYFVFLLAMLPLNVVYKFVEPQLAQARLPVKVVSVGGTLWDGEVVLRHKLTGQAKANWSLDVLPLLWGSANGSFQLDASSLQASAQFSVSALNGEASLQEINTYVQAGLINQALRRNRVSMEGDVELSKGQLVYNLYERQAKQANGNLVWVGGDVSYPKGRKTKSATMPMLVAKLGADKGELKANVTTTEGLAVAKAYVKPDGWAGISVMKRLIDLVGEPWPNKASADSTIFDVSERLFSVK